MKRDIKDKRTALRVNKETIRIVTDSQLEDVAGGSSATRLPTFCLACRF